MFKLKSLIILCVLILVMVGCSDEAKEVPAWQNRSGANLQFDIRLNPEMYRLSNFGEPPQMALWIENLDDHEIRTLWVTNRLARGVWVGKVVCPTALPYWISRREVEKGGGLPSFLTPLPDGITGATPKEVLRIYTRVEPGSRWRYYLELNVSGDYNNTFPASKSNGLPDPDGNGQPSLIYSGVINTIDMHTDTAKVLGHTEQMVSTSELIEDLTGYTTAHRVLQVLTATYIEESEKSHD